MISWRRLSRTACALIIVSALAVRGGAQALVIAALNEPPPVDLEDPIEALLAPDGVRVTAWGKTLDFWWVKSLPLVPATDEVSWAVVEEGSLVGAVKLSAPYPDIRGQAIRAGLYTLRYAIRPQNRDHLGVSPYRDFLLLSPAMRDGKIAALGHDGVIALATQAPRTSHPPSWSLDPPVAPAGTGAAKTTRENGAGQTAVIFSVPVSREGTDAGVLTFGLILVGTIQPDEREPPGGPH
jgi:hypothetical protein